VLGTKYRVIVWSLIFGNCLPASGGIIDTKLLSIPLFVINNNICRDALQCVFTRKIMKTIAFTILSIALIILPGYFVFPMMSVLFSVWIGAFLIARWKGLYDKLNSKEKIYYTLVIFLYPFFELIIKYMLANDVIPYSWNWLNRIEHFIAAIGIQVLFYPFLRPTLLKLNAKESFLFLVFTCSFIGVLNEFLEYGIRIYYHLTDTTQFSYYYWDTIYDMAINVIGATVGFFLLNWLRREDRLKVKG
jgi:hypothetical protein